MSLDRTLCLCVHERRNHAIRFRPPGRAECLARIEGRRYGRARCHCLRFVEAPFEWQQPDLFTGDAAARLAAEFGRGVTVLEVGHNA